VRREKNEIAKLAKVERNLRNGLRPLHFYRLVAHTFEPTPYLTTPLHSNYLRNAYYSSQFVATIPITDQQRQYHFASRLLRYLVSLTCTTIPLSGRCADSISPPLFSNYLISILLFSIYHSTELAYDTLAMVK